MVRASYIITFFNAGATIKECVESLLTQSIEEIEVIAVDDGSTDNSLNILKAIDDPRLILVSGEKLGRVGALNKGLSLAKSNYVGILDADDMANANRTKVQAEFLDNHPEISLVFSNVELIDEQGSHIGKTSFSGNEDETKRTLLNLHPFAHSSAMFRKDTVDEFGGYNPRLKRSVDYNLYLELLLNKHRISGIEQCLCKLRVSNSSWGKVDSSTVQFFYGTLGLFNYHQSLSSGRNLLRASEEDFGHFFQAFSQWYEERGINSIVKARNEATVAKQSLKLGNLSHFLSSSLKVLKKYPFVWNLKKTTNSLP